MCRSSAAVLMCTALVFWSWRDSLLAVDNLPTDQRVAAAPEHLTKAISAPDKAVVRDIVYGLEAEEDRLFLTSQPLNGADRELKRLKVKFDVPHGATVVELALAKMDSKNLMAVVKVKREAEFDFYCLTFIGPRGGGHVRDLNGGCFNAKFFTTRDNIAVLALSGKHGYAFIVLGKMGPDDDRDDDDSWVTEGVMYFNGCPWPPSDGPLSPFRAKSLPRTRQSE